MYVSSQITTLLMSDIEPGSICDIEPGLYNVGCFQFGPPILNIFSWVPVAQPVAPWQWGEQGRWG